MRRVVWASSETVLELLRHSASVRAHRRNDRAAARVVVRAFEARRRDDGGAVRPTHRIGFVGLEISNIMEPGDYARFPTFWDDPTLENGTCGVTSTRATSRRPPRLGLEADVDGARICIVAAADTVMPQASGELMAQVYPGVPLAVRSRVVRRCWPSIARATCSGMRRPTAGATMSPSRAPDSRRRVAGDPRPGRTARSARRSADRPRRALEGGTLLDEADLDLEAGQEQDEHREQRTFGTTSASPTAVNAAPLKIGLRTSANGPLVTSGVRTSGSTSPRHRSPMASCEPIVTTIPSTTSTTPPSAAGRSRMANGASPASSARGAAIAKSTPIADRTGTTTAQTRLVPEPDGLAPVRRYWTTPRTIETAQPRQSGQVEDGHRHYRTVRRGRLRNRRSHVRLVRPTDTTARDGGPHFTGPAWLREPTPPWTGYRATVVDFAPGTRNDWHHHPGGQVLFVLTGHGRVVAKRVNGLQEETFGPGASSSRNPVNATGTGDRRQLHEPPVGDRRGHGVGNADQPPDCPAARTESDLQPGTGCPSVMIRS